MNNLFPSYKENEHPSSLGKSLDACGIGAIFNVSGILVSKAVTALTSMEHRGSWVIDDSGRISGDGAGLLMKMPLAAKRWVSEVCPGFEEIEPFENIGIGMFFLPRKSEFATDIKQGINEIIKKEGLEILGWRQVPVDPDKAELGAQARKTMPKIFQLFIKRKKEENGSEFEKSLFIVRKKIEAKWHSREIYISSLSCRVVCFKGMLTSKQLTTFYTDLDEKYHVKSEIIIFHRRFSTNTFPDWILAQAFRMIAHNGEINSIAANRAAVRNIEGKGSVTYSDILSNEGSDSADFDRVVELFYQKGYSLPLALSALIPPAWRTNRAVLDNQIVQFYQYHKHRLGSLGQWEGPAAILATDGNILVAKVDRIGLRPLRWMRLKDDSVLICSEVGAFEIDSSEIVSTGKLGSGQILQVDKNGRFLFDSELILEELNDNRSLKKEINSIQIVSPNIPQKAVDHQNEKLIKADNNLYQFTKRPIETIEVLMSLGKEPIVSMGKAKPAAALSFLPSSIYDFYFQMFAQITNPPIDFVREQKFFDLTTYLGDRESNNTLEFPSPNLDYHQISFIEKLENSSSISIGFKRGNSAFELSKNCISRLNQIFDGVKEEINKGKNLLIFTDKSLKADEFSIPGPWLISYLHHHLVEAKLRTRCRLILHSKDMREPHDMAVNLAFGANAVYASLLWDNGAMLSNKVNKITGINSFQLMQNLKVGLDNSLLKIMSKMGVTTTDGYRDSQLFMPFGFADDIEKIIYKKDVYALGGRTAGDILNFYNLRQNSPKMKEKKVWVDAKQHIYKAAENSSSDHLKRYEDEREKSFKLLHMLDIKKGSNKKDIFIESASEIIVKYFVGAAMSHGALKDVAHRAIAAAFNDLGGRSNSGEGGENPNRDGTRFRSKIRQIASGRFGVAASYLANADEIQIKIAQGAKPGEGGQLMGNKVDEVIAKNRNCDVGTTLISPQTHQDIYSVEDLKQLIHDMKALNPKAQVSVKIAAEVGIGIIAVAAVKMGIDTIEIDGLHGGTAATPESSKEHAAHYAEVGLTAVHRELLGHNLRHFVKLRVASGIRTGADIVKYALLGADEFSIGTSLLVAMGCVTCEMCHTGSCPTEICGDPRSKKQMGASFDVRVDRIKNYLTALAKNVIEIAQTLGESKLSDLTGQARLLSQKTFKDAPHLEKLNLDFLLTQYEQTKHIKPEKSSFELFQQPEITLQKNQECLQKATDAINQGKSLNLTVEVKSSDLSFGATIAGEISKKWPKGYAKDEKILINARGYGGQKFGFATVSSLEIKLTGFANDSPGAAISGGVLIIVPPDHISNPDEQVVAGNAVGYGATGGEIDIWGKVGERCAIRNSGASIVVSSAMDFLGEYQTGGETISLSLPGREIGAGHDRRENYYI